MESQNSFVLDTDFLIAIILDNEPNHAKALEILKRYPRSNFIVSNLVKYEFCTVMSRKLDHHLAISLFDSVPWQEMDYIFLDPDLESKTLSLYKSFSKKNISFTDCSNLILAREYNVKIAAFDKFYPVEWILK
jgi:uncharacterized protein